MPSRNELGREAVGALATAAVVVGGTMVLVFVIVAGSEQPGPYLAGLAVGVAVFSLLLFMLRSRPDKSTKRQPWYRVFRRPAARAERQIIVEKRSDLGPGSPPSVENGRAPQEVEIVETSFDRRKRIGFLQQVSDADSHLFSRARGRDSPQVPRSARGG